MDKYRTLRAFLDGYQSGVMSDFTLTKKEMVAKISVLRDVMDFITTSDQKDEGD